MDNKARGGVAADTQLLTSMEAGSPRSLFPQGWRLLWQQCSVSGSEQGPPTPSASLRFSMDGAAANTVRRLRGAGQRCSSVQGLRAEAKP